MLGGYQEAGLRSGTMPTHLVVGLGEAIKLLDINKDTYKKYDKSKRQIYSIY